MAAHLKAPKAIVFLSCLLQLFSMCQVPGCGSAIDPANTDVQERGAVITGPATRITVETGAQVPLLAKGTPRSGF